MKESYFYAKEKPPNLHGKSLEGPSTAKHLKKKKKSKNIRESITYMQYKRSKAESMFHPLKILVSLHSLSVS